MLGAAGLLKGRETMTHWGYTELLENMGATYRKGRHVRDGNVITAGGVTSGIDFALRLVAEIAGEEAARSIQLALRIRPRTAIPVWASGYGD